MLKELPADEYFKLKDLFSQIIKEMNGELTADEAIMNFHRAAKVGYLKIFVDFDIPKHVLIISHFPGMVHSGFVCAVNMMYSIPTERKMEYTNAMFDVAFKYAKDHNCETMLGSAWKWKGSRGIDSVWLSKGFELQENVYAKRL